MTTRVADRERCEEQDRKEEKVSTDFTENEGKGQETKVKI